MKQCLIKAKSKHEVESSMYKNKMKSEEVKDPRAKTSKSDKPSLKRHLSTDSNSSSKYPRRVRDPTPINELVKDPKNIPLNIKIGSDDLQDPRKIFGSIKNTTSFFAPVPKFKQFSVSKSSSSSTSVSSSLGSPVSTSISAQRDPRVRSKRVESTERKSPEASKIQIPAALLKKPPSMSIPKLPEFKMPEPNKDPRLNKKPTSIIRKRKVAPPAVSVAPKILKPTLTVDTASAGPNTTLPSLIEPVNELFEKSSSPETPSNMEQIAPYDPRYIQKQMSSISGFYNF